MTITRGNSLSKHTKQSFHTSLLSIYLPSYAIRMRQKVNLMWGSRGHAPGPGPKIKKNRNRRFRWHWYYYRSPSFNGMRWEYCRGQPFPWDRASFNIIFSCALSEDVDKFELRSVRKQKQSWNMKSSLSARGIHKVKLLIVTANPFKI